MKAPTRGCVVILRGVDTETIPKGADRMAKRFNDSEIMTALLSAGSVRAAARELGCGRNTIQRRLDDPAFRTAFNAARDDMVHGLAGALTSAAERGAAVLIQIMETSNDERLRISAADKLLTHAAAFGKLSRAVKDDW